MDFFSSAEIYHVRGREEVTESEVGERCPCGTFLRKLCSFNTILERTQGTFIRGIYRERFSVTTLEVLTSTL